MRRLFCLILLSIPTITVAQASLDRTFDEPTDRLIIGLKEPAASEALDAQSRVKALTTRTGVLLSVERSLTGGMHLVRTFVPQSGGQLKATVAALANDPLVTFAVVDRKMNAQAVPNDPLYKPGNPSVDSGQWYLQPTDGTLVAAIDAQSAWDITTGSENLVMAVVDSGVVFDHPDLGRAGEGGRLLNGYDFVSSDSNGGFLRANDGDGWDADPSDPGDWISAADAAEAVFKDCPVAPSEWHGTRVAGLIGAIANNNIGIVGVTWSGWIQPVRALGKCGGFESDAIAAISWAAGITVSGAPSNPYPANVINLSFGGIGGCDAAYQSAVNAVRAKNITIVAAAGNESSEVLAPASCSGVIAIAAVSHDGSLAQYSNTGVQVALAAPGGDCCHYSDDTTYNLGTSVPSTDGYTTQLVGNEGTSFATPLVTGVVGLMLSVNANLTPDQILARLQSSARPFPQNLPSTVSCPNGVGAACACTTTTCGAGMLDASAAVIEAQRPIAALIYRGTLAPGNSISLSAAGSSAACGRIITSVTWSATNASSTAFSTPSASTTSFTVPNGDTRITLTVTDDQGASDTTTMSVQSGSISTTAPSSAGSHACLPTITQPGATAPAPPSPPAGSSPTPATSPPSMTSSNSGKGGGGALDFWSLLFACLLVLATRFRDKVIR